MRRVRLRNFSARILAIVFLALVQVCLAQDTPDNKSWTTTSQQQSPTGSGNPTRTTETHTEVDGRIVDRTSVEALGPDGRYVPYQMTETEAVRVDSATVRKTERTFGTDSDGHRTLVQEQQEESRTLGGGEQKVVRTVLNPDANGSLKIVQREVEDTKQTGPGTKETKTTVLMPDTNGGLTATMQVERQEKKSSDGTVEFKKSSLVPDGNGHWQVGEIREGTSKEENGQQQVKEERVLRPDSSGKLAVAEHTVSRQTVGPGEQKDTVETYSTNVPGTAGNDSLQLVQRATTVTRTDASGAQSAQQIERLNPGEPGAGLRVAENTVNTTRPDGSGSARQRTTISTANSDGRLGQVWVDLGKTDNPAAIKVDTGASRTSQ